MGDLTAKQEKVLIYIRDHAEETGAPPTLRELCSFMGYRAIGSAQDVVAALRKKGYLQASDRQRARSLLVTEAGRLFGRAGEDLDGDPNTYAVPCLGTIPAGNPLEAVEERVGTLRLSSSILGPKKQKAPRLFALKATGESMVEAGILDGDWLVVQSMKEARKGEIVVARVNGDATVKRLERDQVGWFLKPENTNFNPIYAKDSPFEVIGRVVALQRAIAT